MRSDPELYRHLIPYDPIITVAPDVVFFEGFAKDESSYGCVFVDRDGFEGHADEATARVSGRGMDEINAALRTLEALFDEGSFEEWAYTRSMANTPEGMNWVFHPEHQRPSPAVRRAEAPEAPVPGVRRRARDAEERPPPRRPERNPYEAGDILRFSPEEMRARALKNNPWKTGWTDRVDVIPPLSDEETALIDRGLILRGLLTEEQVREIHRVGDLWLEHHQAHKLAKTQAAKSAQDAIRAMREEAAQRKADKKRAAEERKRKHAELVARRKKTDIIFVGPGVSSRLNDRRCHVEALQQRGLPVLATPADLAQAMGLEVPVLRWLCFHAEAAVHPHYVQFEVPKRSGGTRLLSAPMPKLAAAQRWVLDEILGKLPVEDAAHGFVAKRSTVTNAVPHQGRDVVINLDLKDFFPSITFPRLRGVFAGLGYSPAVATLLALLCTECPRRCVAYAGKRYHVAVGERGLPQGACTSPAPRNQVARKLDKRLVGLARKEGWRYTRYADDLTFSAPRGHRGKLPGMLARIRHVVREEGFRIQEKKGRVQRAAGRQTVTGIVVNEPGKLGLAREEVRRLRAIVHNAEKTGLAAQNRDGHPDFRAHLMGKIGYLSMVDGPKAEALRAALARVSD